MVKRVILLLAIGLCLQFGWYHPAQSAGVVVKELNFVFLHGAGGTVCSLQLLSDIFTEQIDDYIAEYERANPGIEVRANILERCYPNDVDISTWADNVAESINDFMAGKQNLVLIGHSMGGKAALYIAAHNIGGLADKTAMVVTINSPIRSLQQYYFSGGASVLDYYQALGLISDRGVINSIIYYDSTEDAMWVGTNKHWLAFVSAEPVPISPQFNVGGIDAMPRNMDDSIIPISAQHTGRADVVYYGEYSHNDFSDSEEVSGFLAEQILRYIFGGDIDCSVLIRGGNLEHFAGWLPGTDYWEDMVGEVPATSGKLEYTNESFSRWQDWEDVVGNCLRGSTRSSYRVVLKNNFPILSSLEEVRWLLPDDAGDCQLYIKTRVAPRDTLQVEWEVYHAGQLPDTERGHYEVEISTGTPLTSIKNVSWLSDDPHDLRLVIDSEAERPFRWFKMEWRVYAKESCYRQVINEME